MKFYPYDLFVLEQSAVEFDNSGFAQPRDEEFSFVCKCRDYASNQANINHIGAKENINHSSMIMLPLNAPTLSVNTIVEVRNGKEVRLKARIVRFERNQLHCRIWL